MRDMRDPIVIKVISHSPSFKPGLTEGTFSFFEFLTERTGRKGLWWTSTKIHNIELEETKSHTLLHRHATFQRKKMTYACFFLLAALVDE